MFGLKENKEENRRTYRIVDSGDEGKGDGKEEGDEESGLELHDK